MSYVGSTFTHLGTDVTVKLHGRFDEFIINPADIRLSAIKYLEIINTNNITEKANRLSVALCDEMCDGDKILWVQVDVKARSNGFMYGTSAERA